MDSKTSLTLDEALAKNPIAFFQWRLLAMCGLALMTETMEINLLTFLGICAGNEWGLSDTGVATITGMVFAGIVVGNFFWGQFADRYGRKLTYILCCVIISAAGFLSGASPNVYWLIAFRTICGFGIGGSNIPFDLLAEFIPASHRGPFLIKIEYFWTLGSITVTGLAWATLDTLGWRFLTYMTAVPVAIASLVSICYLPESPRWLLLKGKVAEAEEIVRLTAAINGVEMGDFSLVDSEKDGMISDPQYFDLIKRKEARRITLPLWVVWATYGFSYFGLIIFVGRLYGDNSSSGKCSFNYPPIFYNACAEFAGTFIGAQLIDSFGRVKSQAVFYVVAGVAVLLVGFDLPFALLMTFAIIGRMASVAAANATWVATPELYSTDLRTEGHAVASAISNATAFVVPFLIFSPASTLTVAVVLAAVNACAVVACIQLPETTGQFLDSTGKSHPLLVDGEDSHVIHQNIEEVLGSDQTSYSDASAVDTVNILHSSNR